MTVDNSGSATSTPSGILTVPKMQLTQLKFQLLQQQATSKNAAQELLVAVKQDRMAPYYQYLQETLPAGLLPMDQQLMQSMLADNKKSHEELVAKLDDAQRNFGEAEVSDALLALAEHFTRIGDKPLALQALKNAYDKAVGAGMKLDIVFVQLRLGLFFGDQQLINRNLELAQQLVDEGGDWDRRNRLKAYRGIQLLSVRDFKSAVSLLLDSLPTFTATELMEYKDFVKYTVLCALLTVGRADLKSKVLESPEILEVLHEIPHLEDYINSLYQCKYGQFFRSLAEVEAYLKNDYYLHAHFNWYTREMRIVAYKQILESYRSLSLDSMAKHFGVSKEFIDADLAKFISGGRLHCVIDKVEGVVQTNRPDNKNAQYQQCIKEGDLLLNRIQKLSRVINI